MNQLEREVIISENDVDLRGLLAVPEKAQGIIIFAHGSGSGRYSPRNNYVARTLQNAGFATLLMDLLQPEEEEDRMNVFDINLLAGRLHMAKRWLFHQKKTKALEIGYFGASTGAGAAIAAAAMEPANVFAVVSRGGRPDLAGEYLRSIRAPTLLIVGAKDNVVIELNEEAYGKMICEKHLEIVPRATHLFEEPGTLEEVADLATKWFKRHLLHEQDRRPNKNQSINELNF